MKVVRRRVALRVAAWTAIACVGLLGIPSEASAQPVPVAEKVVDIRVHGNHTTPDAEVIRLSGVTVGVAFSDDLVHRAEAQLRRSGRFRQVEIRKRYASIEDPAAIVLVFVVEENAGVSVEVPSPGPIRRLAASTLWLPVLSYADGYGFTYGARFAFVDILGKRTRVAVPLTWGGERRAGVDVERTFHTGPFTRVAGGAATWRRENPAFHDTGDLRTQLSARVERAFTPWLRAGASGSWADIGFGALDDRLKTLGAEAAIDTRRDRVLPRNAVFASVSWERLDFDVAADTHRVQTEVGAGVGLFRQVVFVVRGKSSIAADPLPPYEQALLGGAATPRGFRLGFRAGDNLAAVTAEIRAPFTSVRHIGKSGIAVFVDHGAVYPAGTDLSDARFETGVGAGFFLTAALFSARVDVAHGIDAGTRAHVSFGLSF